MHFGMSYEIDGQKLTAEGRIYNSLGHLFFDCEVIEMPWLNASGQCFFQDLPRAAADLMDRMEKEILYQLSPFPAYQTEEISAFIDAHSVVID